MDLPRKAQQVPEPIIVGDSDNVAGTQLPYEYFKKYRQLRAPWMFTLQNNSPHCCTANAKSLILGWLEEVFSRRDPANVDGTLRQVQRNDDWLGQITLEKANIKDSFRLETFNGTTARVWPEKKKPMQLMTSMHHGCLVLPLRNCGSPSNRKRDILSFRFARYPQTAHDYLSARSSQLILHLTNK